MESLQSRTTGQNITPQPSFKETATRENVQTPQQLRDLATFRLLRMILLKMEPTDEERESLCRIEAIFTVGIKQSE